MVGPKFRERLAEAIENGENVHNRRDCRTAKKGEQLGTLGGREDQRGALNYISNEKRAGAARLVRSGETVSLALPLATRPSRDNPAPVGPVYRIQS